MKDPREFWVVLCTSMLEQSIDLCSACSSKGTTVLALLEHALLVCNTRPAGACNTIAVTQRAWMKVVQSKRAIETSFSNLT